MEGFTLTSARATLYLPVGSITQSRIGALQEALKNDLPNLIVPDGANVAIFANELTGHSLIIASNDFSVCVDGRGKRPDFGIMKSIAVAVSKTLLLDDTSRFSYRVTGLVLCGSGDAMKASLLESRGGPKLTTLGILQGIGRRFFYRGEGALYSDVRVEPFLVDTRHYFVEGTYNVGEPVTMDEVFRRSEAFQQDLMDNIGKFLESSFA